VGALKMQISCSRHPTTTFAIFIVNCLLLCNVRSIFHEVLYVMMFSYCRRFVRRRIYISSAMTLSYITYCIVLTCHIIE